MSNIKRRNFLCLLPSMSIVAEAQTDAVTVMEKSLPANATGVLANNGSGALSWVDLGHRLTPAYFGAAGDGKKDDTQALKLLAAQGYGSISLGNDKTYRITDTIAFAANCCVAFNSSKIVYGGPRDRPAITHGAPGEVNTATIDRVQIQAATMDWENINFVGLRIYNLSRGRLIGDLIQGFTVGHEAYSIGQGYAHAYHQILAINNCKYGTVLTCDGAAGLNYVNENVWNGGDTTNHSDTEDLGSAYGVMFRSINGGYSGHNMNRWFAPCYQIGDGRAGDERVPFFFNDCGRANTIIDARFESGRGVFARLDGLKSTNPMLNKFDVGVVSGDNAVMAITENGVARFNTIAFREQLNETRKNIVVKDIFANTHAYSRTDVTVSDGLHITDVDGNVSISQPARSNLRPRLSSIELLSSRVSIGFFIRTAGDETFTLRAGAETSHSGRLGVALFDEKMLQLTSESYTYPDLLSGMSDVPYQYSDAFGGSYVSSVDGDTLTFRVGARVRYIRTFVVRGSVNARIRTLSIERMSVSADPLLVFSPLTMRPDARYVSEDPSLGVVGIYSQGDMLLNQTATPTGVAFYQCIRGGQLAPTRAASSIYATGDVVENDGKIYVCTRSGMTSAIDGPADTQPEIFDGSVIWRYVSEKAEFYPR